MALLSIFAAATFLASGLAAAAPEEMNAAKVNSTNNGPLSQNQAMMNHDPSAVQDLGGPNAAQFRGPAWVPRGQDLRPQLTQEQTNGKSRLGTLDAPKLPPYVESGPNYSGIPWGQRTSKQTNYYDDVPNTGVTKHYDFTITRQTIAPDGVQKDGLVVNGQYPGPTIEANWGDWIEVTVHNQLDEGTSLHWHGLLQKETPWFDGIPGVQQCPIAPGKTFTYRFRADLFGSSYYHGHYSAQVADGLVGPMVIHGPHDNQDYDVDLGPVLLSDWYHESYFPLVEQIMAPANEKKPPPLSQNNLINGKMNYPCENSTSSTTCTPNAGVSKFSFESGKSYRLRLINAGADGMQKFSIDGHKLIVFANDFVPIVPYETDVVTLGVGQRSDVVVKAIGKPTDLYWMRSDMGPSAFKGGCSLHDGVSPSAVAAIYYENADRTDVPDTKSDVPLSALTNCNNDPLSQTVPYFSMPVPEPTTVQNIAMTFQSNGTHNLFFMNNSTFRTNYNRPVLLEAKNGETNYPAEFNVYNFGSSKSIRMVIYNHAQAGNHPMHMHGHNMYILAQGTGTWNGEITNPENPQRRDVQMLLTSASPDQPSYIVVQFDADNPGVWSFHCHIAWHVSQGLFLNILERPDDIKREMDIPEIMAQTCTDWSAFTGQEVVDQIDSGLRIRAGREAW